MFYIPTRPPPTLKNPDDVSREFNNFLQCCLIKDPRRRYPAKKLKEHPFVQDAIKELNRNQGRSEALRKMVKGSMSLIEHFRDKQRRRKNVPLIVNDEEKKEDEKKGVDKTSLHTPAIESNGTMLMEEISSGLDCIDAESSSTITRLDKTKVRTPSPDKDKNDRSCVECNAVFDSHSRACVRCGQHHCRKCKKSHMKKLQKKTWVCTICEHLRENQGLQTPTVQKPKNQCVECDAIHDSHSRECVSCDRKHCVTCKKKHMTKLSKKKWICKPCKEKQDKTKGVKLAISATESSCVECGARHDAHSRDCVKCNRSHCIKCKKSRMFKLGKKTWVCIPCKAHIRGLMGLNPCSVCNAPHNDHSRACVRCQKSHCIKCKKSHMRKLRPKTWVCGPCLSRPSMDFRAKGPLV